MPESHLTNYLTILAGLLQQSSDRKQQCWLLHNSACASVPGSPATHAQELLHTDILKAFWTKASWRDLWRSAEPSRLHHCIENPTDVLGQQLPRKQWTPTCNIFDQIADRKSSVKGSHKDEQPFGQKYCDRAHLLFNFTDRAYTCTTGKVCWPPVLVLHGKLVIICCFKWGLRCIPVESIYHILSILPSTCPFYCSKSVWAVLVKCLPACDLWVSFFIFGFIATVLLKAPTHRITSLPNWQHLEGQRTNKVLSGDKKFRRVISCGWRLIWCLSTCIWLGRLFSLVLCIFLQVL